MVLEEKALTLARLLWWDWFHTGEQTPEKCLAAVREDGLFLKHVNDQTLEICLAAVRENDAAFDCIRDPILKAKVADIIHNGMTEDQ